MHSITCNLGQQPKTQFRMFFLLLGPFLSFVSFFCFYQWHILFELHLSRIPVIIYTFNECYKCACNASGGDRDKLPFGTGKTFLAFLEMYKMDFFSWGIWWFQYLILFLAWSEGAVVKFSEKWPQFDMFKISTEKRKNSPNIENG